MKIVVHGPTMYVQNLKKKNIWNHFQEYLKNVKIRSTWWHFPLKDFDHFVAVRSNINF